MRTHGTRLYERIRDPYLRELIEIKDETIEMQKRTIDALSLILREINHKINWRLDRISDQEIWHGDRQPPCKIHIIKPDK